MWQNTGVNLSDIMWGSWLDTTNRIFVLMPKNIARSPGIQEKILQILQIEISSFPGNWVVSLAIKSCTICRVLPQKYVVINS